MVEFELLYHEIGSVTNVLNVLSTSQPVSHTECHLRHALKPTRRHTFNNNVAKLLDFALEHQNLYSVISNMSLPLHNLLTKQAVHKEVAVSLLKCIEDDEHVYHSYRRKRLVEKSKKINATTKCKLPHFTDQPKKTPATILKEKGISSKDVAKVQRGAWTL